METVFFRFKNFDNSACIRKPELPDNAIHVWAIEKSVLENKFYKMHDPNKIELVTVPEGMKPYAIDFHELDDYVTGEHDDMPKMVDFDEKLHLIGVFNHDYQVVFV